MKDGAGMIISICSNRFEYFKSFSLDPKPLVPKLDFAPAPFNLWVRHCFRGRTMVEHVAGYEHHEHEAAISALAASYLSSKCMSFCDCALEIGPDFANR